MIGLDEEYSKIISAYLMGCSIQMSRNYDISRGKSYQI
jgi:hypothetical protein